MHGIVKKARSPDLPSALRLTLGKLLTPRLRCHYVFAGQFAAGIGLEVGGPSDIFRGRGLFPIYSTAERIDNCNFKPQTIWNRRGATGEGFRYHWRRRPGAQFFAEATRLAVVASDAYDFVLSSHMLEHSANPLRALEEWKRVLKPGGMLFLVIPHKDGTFDHRRPVTLLAHLLDDYARGVDEDDVTHLPEILALHDLKRDPGAGSLENFQARSRKNAENRSLHHHVFDTRLAVETVSAAAFQICAVEPALPMHIAILATKSSRECVNNEDFLRTDAGHFSLSPFPSDHVAESSR